MPPLQFAGMMHDAESLDLMRQARQKATALLDNLLRQQTELDANPPGIDAQKLAQGQFAVRQAVDAARRTLRGIDHAMQQASISTN